jgi:RNA polymerase-binding transcription factor DksA
MATKKPVKKTAKPAPKAKKAAKPVAKTVKKPAVKKSAAKKTVGAAQKKPSKPAAKPAKKAAAPAKKVAKPVAKPAAKTAKKPAAPAKKVTKPAPKAAAPVKKVKPQPAPKAPAKPVAKPAPAAKAPVKTAPVKAPLKSMPVKPTPLPKPPAVKSPMDRPVREVPAPPLPYRAVPRKAEPMREVKAPKTSVKTSVPYQPDYKPLEQRFDTTSKNNEPLVRYSDTELGEFRELINKKLEAAKKELAYLQGLITRKDEMGGDESENRYMTMEDGSMSMEREQLSQMASRQITYIDHLEKSLIRIENKTYGICRVTGKLIDKARLRAVPHATLSLEAKLGLVKPSSEQ